MWIGVLVMLQGVAAAEEAALLPPGAEIVTLDGLDQEHWRRLSSPTMNYAELFQKQEVFDDRFTLAFFNELIFETPEDNEHELLELSVEVLPIGLESYIDLMVRRRVNSYYCFRVSVPEVMPTALVYYEDGRADGVEACDFLLTEGEWVRVSLRLDGAGMTGEIDGRRVIAWSHDRLAEGRFGLRAGFLPETMIRKIKIVMRNRSTGEIREYRSLW
ncbi:MAG: hypothetical protein CME06_03105 [Gemmatimonadetes bacterium]|nr:hypothetical protein [Gemmatimonadota bacterium]